MKKMYIKPETNSCIIEAQPLMEMSMNETGGRGTLHTTEASGDAMSRDYDNWDE